MPQERTSQYKQYTITISPHDERCSNYAFVISDKAGTEIKHVRMGGETEATALENAKQMIDFEIEYSRERPS